MIAFKITLGVTYSSKVDSQIPQPALAVGRCQLVTIHWQEQMPQGGCALEPVKALLRTAALLVSFLPESFPAASVSECYPCLTVHIDYDGTY